MTAFQAWRAGLSRLRIVTLALAAAAALGLQALAPAWLEALEHLVYDARWRLATQDNGEQRLILIDIDERSLAQVGEWPWPRALMGRLIAQLLDRYRAQLVVLDVVFPEPRAGDAALAAQLRRPQVIGSQVFDFTPGSRNRAGVLADPIRVPCAQIASPGAPALPRATGYLANHASLRPARAGHITPILDDDGKVRRIYPLVAHDGRCYPTLALTAYLKLLGASTLALRPGRGAFEPAWWLVPELKGREAGAIPLAGDYSALIPFGRPRESWVAIPAYEILQGRADPALLRGVVAVVGGTALGLSDVIATPTSRAAAGIELHAQLFAGLLDQDLPQVPRGAAWYNAALIALLALLLLGLLAGVRGERLRNWALPAWLVAASAVAAATNLLLWQHARLALPLAPVGFFILVTMLTLASAEIYLAWRSRYGIFRQLSAYVPEPVAQALAEREVSGAIDAERRTITILFADIQGFGARAEGQAPEAIGRALQQLFGELADIVAAHHGVVDKFIGDALMAIWNAPQDDPEHARHALDAARAIQARVAALPSLGAAPGQPPLRIGIGIQTGEVLVGNFGSPRRRTYTALGEPVIVASRLEEFTRDLNRPILVGAAAAAAAGADRCVLLGRFSVRGLSAPMDVYVPRGG